VILHPRVGVVLARKANTGDTNPVLATNRSAAHEFHLLQRFEAGIVLVGPEVKSARLRKINIRDAFARIKDGEIFLHNAHFSPYTEAHADNVDPKRIRKLLLHAREIRKLHKETERGGMTIVPTKIYLKQGRIKVELALARGKQLHDKRDTLRKKEVEREMDRALHRRD
jgi:SsrA-binding protein